MVGPESIVVDGQRIFDLLAAALWPFLRIGAALMVMPMIGSAVVPRRVRFVLAVGLTLALAPLLPVTQMPEPLSAAWVAAAVRELVAGIAIGLVLQLAFEATAVAGELIAQGMGLAFAQMANPLSGVTGPLMGQMLLIVGGLLFFTSGLHLALVELLVESFRLAPAGSAPGVDAIAPVLLEFMGRVLLVGVTLALPLVVAMLVINLVFGVLGRTAPALNPLQAGLPATLFAGLALLVAVLPAMAEPFLSLVREALGAAAGWMR
jgi:flagellar biosynthetic protein FliR